MKIFVSYMRLFLLSCAIVIAVTCLTVLAALLYVYNGFDGNAALPADCALVFGAAVHRGGEAGPGIERRVQTAVRLYHEQHIQDIVVSGGKGTGQQVSEAEVMQKVLLREGVDPEHIRTEEFATSTIENLTFAQPMMQDCASVVGISDRYHLARIALISSRMRWNSFTTYPSDRNAGVHFELRSTIREALAVIHTAVTFHMGPDGL